jgi:hypothetical protein
MTAPVLSTGNVMSFILPSSIRDVSEAPIPLDPQVTLRQIPQRDIAYVRMCLTFVFECIRGAISCSLFSTCANSCAHNVCIQGPYFLGKL